MFVLTTGSETGRRLPSFGNLQGIVAVQGYLWAIKTNASTADCLGGGNVGHGTLSPCIPTGTATMRSTEIGLATRVCRGQVEGTEPSTLLRAVVKSGKFVFFCAVRKWSSGRSGQAVREEQVSTVVKSASEFPEEGCLVSHLPVGEFAVLSRQWSRASSKAFWVSENRGFELGLNRSASE
jgi:hypothetical protein